MENLENQLEDLTSQEFNNLERERYRGGGMEAPDVPLFQKRITHSISVGKTNSSGATMGMLVFTNCVFENEVGIPQNSNSVFHSCVFNGSVDFDFKDQVLNDCSFNNKIKFNVPSSQVDLSKFSFTNGVEILGSDSINVSNLKFKETLEARLTFSNNIERINLENVIGGKIYFGGFASKVRRNFKLFKIQPEQVNFNDVIFFGTSMIYGKSVIGQINIKDSSGENAELFISDSKLASLEFKSSSIDVVALERCAIDNLLIEEYGSEKFKLSILECKNFEHITLDKFINRGFVLLSKINLVQNGTLKIANSDLGKIDFINCDFSKGIIDFKNSKISEIFFAESSFPEKVVSDKKKDYIQQQLFFGQLSVAAQKQGDTISLLEYSSREVAAHYNRIGWSVVFLEKFGLFLNFLSNDFGRSWPRGVAFSIITGLMFFIGMLISTEQFELSQPRFIWELVPAYLKFMNPLRFFELSEIFKNTPFNEKIELNWQSYVFDFLGKIFVAYGYYQTIQAFRRYGRK